MSLISPPGLDAVDSNGSVNPGWRNWFNAAYNILFALTQSGTTAQRPTTFLWTGRTYFDTSLGYAIWYSGPDWVDAQGLVV